MRGIAASLGRGNIVQDQSADPGLAVGGMHQVVAQLKCNDRWTIAHALQSPRPLPVSRPTTSRQISPTVVEDLEALPLFSPMGVDFEADVT
jgi:hypothetical protein